METSPAGRPGTEPSGLADHGMPDLTKLTAIDLDNPQLAHALKRVTEALDGEALSAFQSFTS